MTDGHDSIRKQTILAVDDAPEVLEVICGVLDNDWQVKIAINGDEALRIASTLPAPDLILLDVMMSGMDGYEVCTRLKANQITAHIPVIFLTSKVGQEDEEKGFDVGAVDYITKPISPPILKARVRTHLMVKSTRDYLKNQVEHMEKELEQRLKSNTAMQKLLFTDQLTGIANREAITRRIEDRILRQRRSRDSHPFALLYVDLNGFKEINDRFGHNVGDMVLKEFASRLVMGTRESDLAARFGGDEFVVLLENVGSRNCASKVREELEVIMTAPLQALKEYVSDPSSIRTSAAIGMALCPEDGTSIETLLKKADEEMYLRKKASMAGR